ncbi:MAG: GGDEF domain-containing protein [Thermoleophilia bacterium]|nr:GGDEF domain-containing protein [Thermoleophilia bacterium]
MPSLVAPAVAVFLGRLLIALGTASEELHHLARTDALTGALNRRAFAEDAGALLARRAEGTVLVLMVDVDDFKQVNDRHGHATGDRALCLLAENLSEAVRTQGLVGRLGGDEFAVVVAADPPERAALARRLERACDLGEIVPALRASSGLLDVTGSIPLDEALRRADHELYAAKRAARPEPLPVA